MNSIWQAAPGTVTHKSNWTQWGGRAVGECAATWKPQIQNGWSWHTSHGATGSDHHLHPHPDSDSFCINSDKTFSLSPCLRKRKSFPKHQEQFQILVAGTLLSAQGTKAPDERDCHRLLSLLVPKHQTHSCCCLLACWSCAFISQGLAHNGPFCITIHPIIQLITSLHWRLSEITSTSLVLEPQVAATATLPVNWGLIAISVTHMPRELSPGRIMGIRSTYQPLN